MGLTDFNSAGVRPSTCAEGSTPSHSRQSPDGSKIAWDSLDENTNISDIWVMDSDGSNQIRLGADSISAYKPAWSPDGSKIAFVSRHESTNTEIWVMDADGSNQTRLTTNSDSDDHPFWSPDGSKIAFGSGRDTDAGI